MDKFEKDLEIGEIHARDRWQFELKSDFYPHPSQEKPIYNQEFYLFVPNALQVNNQTYSKKQFYSDVTNLIRYKTPQFTIAQLIDPENSRSPLNILLQRTSSQIEDELKLLANIIRSSLRTQVRTIVRSNEKDVAAEVQIFSKELRELRASFLNMKEKVSSQSPDKEVQRHLEYTDEFISNSVNFYLTGLLEHIRKKESLKVADEQICSLLKQEYEYRDSWKPEPLPEESASEESEFILYRRGLLNKFIMDALLLNINRFSLKKKYSNLIGATAAGIAMLFFMILFVMQGRVFVVNSEPFILLTVVLYILKDRIKESLREVSFRKAMKWFSDYTTEIRTPDGEDILGNLKESFSFATTENIPDEIVKVRNLEFHTLLESFKRPETVLYYKSVFEILQKPILRKSRRAGFNMISRFNIHHFLAKASRPLQGFTRLNTSTNKLEKTRLPKVYHINIILKNTYLENDRNFTSEIKKYRLIVDKNGIKRVENLD